ncbi:MAG TPA: SlyX family protein [Rhodospirillales bacterium]|nr:SlyX family protein [Rhodospirillales bacterium]
MTDSIEKRLDRLEESAAHNDLTDSALSDEVAKQWRVIDSQAREIARLKEKIEGLEADLPGAPDAHQPPPHY